MTPVRTAAAEWQCWKLNYGHWGANDFSTSQDIILVTQKTRLQNTNCQERIFYYFFNWALQGLQGVQKQRQDPFASHQPESPPSLSSSSQPQDFFTKEQVKGRGFFLLPPTPLTLPPSQVQMKTRTPQGWRERRRGEIGGWSSEEQAEGFWKKETVLLPI